MRFLILPSLLALAACTFGGSGIAPFEPAPAARVGEDDLDVPYVPTPAWVVEAMLDMAAVGPDDFVIDLGSGDGRIAIAAARRGARALGVDIDPDRIVEANRAARFAGVETRALFRRQDLFETPLREASVVTMYLLPGVNMRLRPRLLTELRPGARVVSHNFDLGDWRPDATREVGASRAFLWTVPAPAGGEWILVLPDGRRLALALEQRFQEVSGTLDGRELREVTLSGRRIAFTVTLPEGERRFAGLVEDAGMVADRAAAGSVPGWEARRAAN